MIHDLRLLWWRLEVSRWLNELAWRHRHNLIYGINPGPIPVVLTTTHVRDKVVEHRQIVRRGMRRWRTPCSKS